MEMNFYVPTKIITGKDCIINNSGIFRMFGKKCLIVTGKNSAERCGALYDVKTALEHEGILYTHFNGIGQNPTFDSCFCAAQNAVQSGAEFIIGIGGGSPLDAAKAVAALAANPGMSAGEMYGANWQNKPLPIIAAGTTAGTGSEVTPVAVITSPEGLKKSFRADTTYPAVSFGDAKYTLSLSPEFTRSTALDALCHCVESYFNRATNEICRTFAIRGIKILKECLEKTADNCVLSYTDREKLYHASLYGGLAISVAGTCFPHAMGYFLSENHGIPHGYACAVYLEEFILHSAKENPDEKEMFFNQTGTDLHELLSLVSRNLPNGDKTLGLKLSEKQINEVLPRFADNKNFKKCYGNADTALAEKILRGLFGE